MYTLREVFHGYLGSKFKDLKGNIYVFTKYDPKVGIELKKENTVIVVNETVFSTKYYRIQMNFGAKKLLKLIAKLHRIPTAKEFPTLAMREAAIERLIELEYLTPEGHITPSGLEELKRR